MKVIGIQGKSLDSLHFPSHSLLFCIYGNIGVRGEGEARSLNGIGSSCAHVGAGRGPDGVRRRARGLRPSTWQNRKSRKWRRRLAAAKTRGKRNVWEPSRCHFCPFGQMAPKRYACRLASNCRGTFDHLSNVSDHLRGPSGAFWAGGRFWPPVKHFGPFRSQSA